MVNNLLLLWFAFQKRKKKKNKNNYVYISVKAILPFCLLLFVVVQPSLSSAIRTNWALSCHGCVSLLQHISAIGAHLCERCALLIGLNLAYTYGYDDVFFIWVSECLGCFASSSACGVVRGALCPCLPCLETKWN